MGSWKIGAVCLIVGGLAGYMLRPEPEVKIKEVVKVETRVDEQIRIVEKPDGTKVTDIQRKSRTEEDKATQVEKKNPRKRWLVGVQKGLTDDRWGATVGRRVIGDIYLGGSVDTRGNAMLSLQVLF